MKKLALSLALVLFVEGPVLATCGGGGGGGVGGVSPSGGQEAVATYQVPWKVVTAEAPKPEGLLIAYWFPTSPEQARGSDLQGSRVLTLGAARCVTPAIVPADLTALRGQYQLADGVAAVVVVSAADGVEVGRVAAPAGKALGRSEVEKVVNAAINAREKAIDQQLDGASAKEKAGDKEGAIALYNQVYEQRCFAPRPAKKAAKALKKLGQAVSEDASLDLPLPDLREKTETRIARALADGLRAENELRLADAERFYQAARKIDLADPVPLRYLGELERHHTGEWERAKVTFQKLLSLRADPLSRAVALHGLGKMTIHGGEFKKGLGLFEESVRTFPLPIAYRNLAVFWNSEGDPQKAYGYTQQALALDPDDRYNQIFGATFMIHFGDKNEAARIARANEDVLAASYNLAAIWAQLGDRDKALALLKRHFYEYEQNDKVRAKEMEEARVDIVFASLKDDPAFRELIKLADHETVGGR